MSIFKIIPDKQRVAVIKDGVFKGLKGPGIVVGMPLASTEWISIGIGDIGTMMTLSSVRIKNVVIPTEGSSIGINGPVEVVGFKGSAIIVASYEGSRKF